MTSANLSTINSSGVKCGDGDHAVDERSETELSRTKRILVAIYLCGVALFVSALIAYAIGFNDDSIVAQADAWGQFGDFIGGVTNPLIGLLGLGGLLWTIYQNQRELSLTRRELRNSSLALQQSNQIATTQAVQLAMEEEKDDILRLVAVIHEDIRHELDKEGAFEGITGSEELRIYNSIRGALGYDFYGKSLSHAFSLLSNQKYLEIESSLESLVRDRVDKVAEMLVQLRDSLTYFNSLAPNNVVLTYYSRRFFQVVEVLTKIGAVDATTTSFYASHLTLRSNK